MRIIESSVDYRERQRKEKEKSACPECGSTRNLGIYYDKNKFKGFFKTEVTRVTKYNCLCGCRYEVDEVI